MMLLIPFKQVWLDIKWKLLETSCEVKENALDKEQRTKHVNSKGQVLSRKFYRH